MFTDSDVLVYIYDTNNIDTEILGHFEKLGAKYRDTGRLTVVKADGLRN